MRTRRHNLFESKFSQQSSHVRADSADESRVKVLQLEPPRLVSIPPHFEEATTGDYDGQFHFQAADLIGFVGGVRDGRCCPGAGRGCGIFRAKDGVVRVAIGIIQSQREAAGAQRRGVERQDAEGGVHPETHDNLVGVALHVGDGGGEVLSREIHERSLERDGENSGSDE